MFLLCDFWGDFIHFIEYVNGMVEQRGDVAPTRDCNFGYSLFFMFLFCYPDLSNVIVSLVSPTVNNHSNCNYWWDPETKSDQHELVEFCLLETYNRNLSKK